VDCRTLAGVDERRRRLEADDRRTVEGGPRREAAAVDRRLDGVVELAPVEPLVRRLRRRLAGLVLGDLGVLDARAREHAVGHQLDAGFAEAAAASVERLVPAFEVVDDRLERAGV